MVKEYIIPEKKRITSTDDVKARMRISYNKHNVADVRIGSIQVCRCVLEEQDMKDPDKAVREYVKPAMLSSALRKFNNANAKRKATIKANKRKRK